MKLKLVAAVSALAIPALAHAEQSGPPPAVPKPTKALNVVWTSSKSGGGDERIHANEARICE